MKLVIVYKEASEQRLPVEAFMRDFKFQTGGEIETIDPDSREGSAFCQTYDVVEYPTMLALADDGTPAATWKGSLPTISDASGYK